MAVTGGTYLNINLPKDWQGRQGVLHETLLKGPSYETPFFCVSTFEKSEDFLFI